LENEKGEKLVVKVFKAVKHPGTISAGMLFVNDKNQLFVNCRNGCIEILELQAEGRKRMSTSDFLRGFPLDPSKWKAIS